MKHKKSTTLMRCAAQTAFQFSSEHGVPSVFLSLSLIRVSCTIGFNDHWWRACTVISTGLAILHMQPIKSLIIQQAPPVLFYHDLYIRAEGKVK